MIPRIGRDLTRSIGSSIRHRPVKTTLILAVATFGLLIKSMVGVHDNLKRRLLCSHVMHRGGWRQLLDEDCATIWPIEGKSWRHGTMTVDVGKGHSSPFFCPSAPRTDANIHTARRSFRQARVRWYLGLPNSRPNFTWHAPTIPSPPRASLSLSTSPAAPRMNPSWRTLLPPISPPRRRFSSTR